MTPAATPPFAVAPELAYVGLLFALFVLPKLLQRYRIPSAISALVLGIIFGSGFELFHHDATVELLSTLGIASLFLFAGLDVEVPELRRNAGFLSEHLGIGLFVLVGGAWGAMRLLGLEWREAAIVSLALFTPSTGFILDSLASLGLPQRARFWVRTKAIATELVALAAMFVVLQSASAARLTLSAAILAGMILVLPFVFRLFASVVVPHAPRSEFAFLVMVAVACALVTRRLGVYYLVGAFVVGMTAQRFREKLPAMTSEKMLHSVESFASVFAPFYFFHAGLGIRSEDLGLGAILTAATFLVVALPIRVLVVSVHRRLRFKEGFRESFRVGVPMLPTLVFTLVLAGILRDRFDVSSSLFGGLVLYAIGNTLIPSLAFGGPPQPFDEPELSPVGVGLDPPPEP